MDQMERNSCLSAHAIDRIDVIKIIQHEREDVRDDFFGKIWMKA